MLASHGATGVIQKGLMERWASIKGLEGRYEVSSLGRIRRIGYFLRGKFYCLNQPKIVQPNIGGGGYLVFSFFNGTRKKKKRIHRAVLEAFVGPCPPKYECGHLDGQKTNNVLSNLKWVTPKENSAHRKVHGTEAYGERNGNSKKARARRSI